MTIQAIIKKFKPETATTPDGTPAIKISGKKPNAKEVEFIKANKSAIIEEIQRIEAEKEAARELRRAEREAEREIKKAEYLRTADLRRCLVCYLDEYYHEEWYIVTLAFDATGDRAFRADFGSNRVNLEHVTESMKSMSTTSTSYGLGGTAWEITPEQEARIIAEQTPAAEEAEQQAVEKKAIRDAEIAEKKAAREAERQAKFDEAKATGKKVFLGSWSTECCDPSEECSTDIHHEWAMPDGSTEHTWNHTW